MAALLMCDVQFVQVNMLLESVHNGCSFVFLRFVWLLHSHHGVVCAHGVCKCFCTTVTPRCMQRLPRSFSLLCRTCCQGFCLETCCVCPQLFQFAHNHLRCVWGKILLLSVARASPDGGGRTSAAARCRCRWRRRRSVVRRQPKSCVLTMHCHPFVF